MQMSWEEFWAFHKNSSLETQTQIEVEIRRQAFSDTDLKVVMQYAPSHMKKQASKMAQAMRPMKLADLSNRLIHG